MTEKQITKYENQKVTFDTWQERLDQKTNDKFVLVDIIENEDGKFFKAECKVCKEQYEGNVARLQPAYLKKKHNCSNCDKQERLNKLLAEKQLKEETKFNKQIFKCFATKYLKYRRAVKLMHRKYKIIECVYCGSKFEGRGHRTTCDSCKIAFSERSMRTLAVLTRPHDTGITLKKLYERDKGICYLCGGLCDWNSKHLSNNGTVVVEDYYPTIEHVIPLAKEGTHQWSNVKLAHFICNSQKGAKLVG